MDAHGAQVWTLRDGRVVRVKGYQSKNGLEAVKLVGSGAEEVPRSECHQLLAL